MLVVFELCLLIICPITSQHIRQAYFTITANSVYIPQLAAAFLLNITSNSISGISECGQKCLSYELCRTATYYEEIRTCSLYSEESNTGQIFSVVNQASFVLGTEPRETPGKN